MLGSESYVFHRRLDYNYPIIKYGKGIYLFDENGKKYIDAASGAAVTSVGHCHPEVCDKIKQLSEKIVYLHNSQYSTDLMENYAKELCSLSNGVYNKVFFVSSGSEAIESAIKLARQFHCNNKNEKKYKLIARWPSYHGSTIASLSLTGKAAVKKYYVPYLLDVEHIRAPFCYHCPYDKSPEDCNVPCAYELKEIIDRIGSEYISAFVFEPVIGSSAGAVVSPDKYYEVIQSICKEKDILLISDEIMCGFGRIGEWFAFHKFEITPDITVLGKGIAGGYVPLSAIFCNDRIFNTIKEASGSFLHGLTFENAPFGVGVGNIILSIIKKYKYVKNSQEMGLKLKQGLKSELALHNRVGDIRGLGLFCAVEIVKDKENRIPFERKMGISEKIVTYGMEKGINLYYSIGFMQNGDGDAILFAPPLSVNSEEIDEITRLGVMVIKRILDAL